MFDTNMHVQALNLLRLETDLRRAIERQEFQFYYQPILSLEGCTIIGLEALVRWQHPEKGLLSPVEFIPTAEETGLIVSIGEWVLYEACRQMQVWQKQFPTSRHLTISVNLSGKQFLQPDLIEQIERVLKETNFDAHNLQLEITESVIMNAESSTTTLSKLRALGIQLQIDDFGTGYSSLSYLHHFPIDTLKIDRSFVSNMSVGADKSEIIRTIVTLAHNLGMNVTAEGIETAEQLAQLKMLQCEYGQGYFFFKPMSSEVMEVLLAG